jgi:drug/metabolite transporter (DMT)-like permease
MRSKARIALLFTCFFWAISFVASKTALDYFPPLTVVTLRMVVSSLCFVFLFTLRRPHIPYRRLWPSLLLLSLFGTGLHYTIQTYGLTLTSAANAGVYAVTSPITITIIAWLFLKEKLRLFKILGMLLALVGVILVIGPDKFIHFSLSGNLLGDLLVMISIFMWGIFTVLSKRYGGALPALSLTGAITFLGTLMMLPFGAWEMGHRPAILLEAPPKAWLAILFLGITCSFLATLLYLYALKETESQKVGAYLYTIPPMTQLAAFFILGESIAVGALLGMGLVLAGVYMTERG